MSDKPASNSDMGCALAILWLLLLGQCQTCVGVNQLRDDMKKINAKAAVK